MLFPKIKNMLSIYTSSYGMTEMYLPPIKTMMKSGREAVGCGFRLTTATKTSSTSAGLATPTKTTRS